MAHWIVDDHGFGGQDYRCSRCNQSWSDIYYSDISMKEHCPSCGAPIDIDKTEYLEKKRVCPKIINTSWEDFGGGKTEALSIDVDRLYTVSEFIALLEEAKQRWGDKEVVFHDMNANVIGGFSIVYLHHGFDDREEYGEDYYMDDQICIYG